MRHKETSNNYSRQCLNNHKQTGDTNGREWRVTMADVDSVSRASPWRNRAMSSGPIARAELVCWKWSPRAWSSSPLKHLRTFPIFNLFHSPAASLVWLRWIGKSEGEVCEERVKRKARVVGPGLLQSGLEKREIQGRLLVMAEQSSIDLTWPLGALLTSLVFSSSKILMPNFIVWITWQFFYLPSNRTSPSIKSSNLYWGVIWVIKFLKDLYNFKYNVSYKCKVPKYFNRIISIGGVRLYSKYFLIKKLNLIQY